MEASILERIYTFGLELDRRLTRVHELACPVLSVGNIASGGRAKTPFVIYLSQWLSKQDFHPVVLTRGYGRQESKAVALKRNEVIPGSSVAGESAALAGDEACEIFAFGSASVLVGAKRYQNALNFLSSLSQDEVQKIVFILDDGFQHWSLKRNFDLVLVREEDYTGALLPKGTLRESPAALSRANLVLMQNKDFKKKSRLCSKPPESSLLLTTRAPDAEYVQQLRDQGLETFEMLALRDHANREQMVKALHRTKKSHIVVGAKEAVKLVSFELFKRLPEEKSVSINLGQKKIQLHFVACELELSAPHRIFDPLQSLLVKL